MKYYGGLDLGLRVDGSALAIAHREMGLEDRIIRTIVDGVWYWPAGSASMGAIIHRTSAIIRSYKAATFSDQYHYDSVRNDFAKERVNLIEVPWTALGGRSKTVRFNSVRLAMGDGRIRLPDDKDLIRELHNFGGRLRRNGTEELAARSGHDDRVHAVVLVCSEIMERQPDRKPTHIWTFEEYQEKKEAHYGLSHATGVRYFHPVFDDDRRHTRCLSYPEYVEYARAGYV